MWPIKRWVTPPWGVRFGSWWMVQWSFDSTFSLGFHFDPKTRIIDDGSTYGPYLDLHVGPFAVSIGNRPASAWNDSLMRPGRW